MNSRINFVAACVAALCAGNTFAQFAGVAVDNNTTATTYTESGPVSRPTSGNGSATIIYAGDGLGSDSALTVSGIRVNADLYQASGDSSSLHVTQTGSQLVYRQAATGVTSVVQIAPQATFIGTVNGSNRLTSGLSSNGITGQNTLTGITNTAGIVNTGSLATDTLNTTGNATVGGNLGIAGTTTTNGIDNSGKRISNVAAGQTATDAANVGQMNAMSNNQAVVNQGQATMNANQAAFNANQTNANAAMQSQTVDNRKVASTGTSIAVAAASIPALEQGKNFGFGAGAGTYDSRAAIALGIAARISDALQIKVNVGTGSGGRVGAGAGGLWSW
jgi:autotransporter adhesin